MGLGGQGIEPKQADKKKAPQRRKAQPPPPAERSYPLRRSGRRAGGGGGGEGSAEVRGPGLGGRMRLACRAATPLLLVWGQ